MTYTRWGSKENEPVLNKNMDRGKAVIREGWHRTQSLNAVRAERRVSNNKGLSVLFYLRLCYRLKCYKTTEIVGITGETEFWFLPKLDSKMLINGVHSISLQNIFSFKSPYCNNPQKQLFFLCIY